MTRPIEVVLIGAGSRGQRSYGPYALDHPDELQFVGVAEPNDVRRERFAQAHGIPSERCFRTWEDMLAQGQMADGALICTLDDLHVGPTTAALEAGYDILLEKPIANGIRDCMRLVQAAEQAGRLLMVCHVLRYTWFFSTLHDILASGRLGDIITVEHRENAVYWHMAHSFVRGNWRSKQLSSPMILQKCCHDLDILFWNLGPIRRLSSFGSLRHYRAENAPDGAPKRCTDGCPVEAECPWSALRLYLDPANDPNNWPIAIISEDTSVEARRHALETGPYGRCVYHCDNDVVDHQTVNMQSESGISIAMTMHGHSHREGRTMRYDGTRATLRGCFYATGSEIEIHDHLNGQVETIRRAPGALGGGGHGGGDEGLMRNFVRALREGGAPPLTSGRASLESHLMAFAAEDARLEGRIIEMDDYRHQVESDASRGSQ
jgi:predicted dehydrogenase